MKSLTPWKPVKFKHEGGWKTGTLMREDAFDSMLLIKLHNTGEVVLLSEYEHTLEDNPCRENERAAELSHA